MKVTESQFMKMFLPTCHAALAAHAMYYGEGEWANRQRGISTIADELHCSKGDVHALLDLAESMLADASQMKPSGASGHRPERAPRKGQD